MGIANNNGFSHNSLMENATNDTLEQFVSGLISAKGLDALDEETLADLRTDLHERIERRINMVLIEKLNPEKLDEAEKIVESGDQATIHKFFETNIQDADQIVAAELLNFRDRYLTA